MKRLFRESKQTANENIFKGFKDYIDSGINDNDKVFVIPPNPDELTDNEDECDNNELPNVVAGK